MADETELDIGTTLQKLLAGQVALQRRIAEQDAKIALLVQLVDFHQHTLEVAKATAIDKAQPLRRYYETNR
jgi:hypothetical protein